MSRPGVPVAAIVFALCLGWPLRCLVLKASQFQHLLHDLGQTHEAYASHAGHALSLQSPKRRGRILNDFCKKTLAQLHPDSKIEEPRLGTCCNGARRSASQAEYDFILDGRKVRCKSAQMSWRKAQKSWGVSFHSIKLPLQGFRDQAPFDDLYLIIFSPDSLHIIKHDLQTGVTSSGKRTGYGGHCIRMCSACRQEGWQKARSQILGKFLADGHCELVAQVDLCAVQVSSWLKRQMKGIKTLQDNAYKGVPLNGANPTTRGLRIKDMAFEVDQILHPNCSPGAFSRCLSAVDWVRGGVKVEVKHGQMRLNNALRRWQCEFSGIKCASAGTRDRELFDELWLAIYSPLGIHLFKHPGGHVRLSLTGLNEQEAGRKMFVRASQKVLDVRQALDEMLEKLENWGCELLATVLWDNGGSFKENDPLAH